MGMPMKRLAKATPSSSAGRKLPRVMHTSQLKIQVQESPLPRNSKATARKMRQKSRMSRGAYRALNMTA